MVLSQRLLTIAHAVTPKSRVADIGTDHALLPIYLKKNKIADHVVAVDITAKPLTNAARNIAQQLGDNPGVELRMGDGLSTIQADEVDTIIIAGMGGLRTRQIIMDGLPKCRAANQLILQPNTNWAEVRAFLWDNGFAIVEENMLEERGQFFLTLVVTPGEQSGSPMEAVGGIILSRQPSLIFDRWLRKRHQTLEDILLRNPDRSLPKVEADLKKIVTLITQRANHYKIP